MNVRWTQQEEKNLVNDIINEGLNFSKLSDKYNRSSSALELRFKKIIFDNINNINSDKRNEKMKYLSKMFHIDESKINQYYYSYKEMLDKKENKFADQPKINSEKKIIDNKDKITNIKQVINNISDKKQSGGTKTTEHLEEENRRLKAIIENKKLRDSINRLAKEGKIDHKTKALIKELLKNK